MSVDHYVLLGLAHVRSAWNTEVARWATSGSLPVEFVKCISAEELTARVRGGRRFSAALLDARLTAVDRDLLALLGDSGVATIVVSDPADAGNWQELGATATLAEEFGRAALLDALATHAELLGSIDERTEDTIRDAVASASWRGRLIAVSGAPGVGTSTVAAALAQGVAHDPRYSGDVVLADLALHAHQGLLHDARDVVPGIQELVDAHRHGKPTIEQHRALTFDVSHRNYRLLLGLRRQRDWVSIRSHAFRSALDGLRRSARIVVADTDGDLEGEAETGSYDIEDRNQLARTTHDMADLVVAVGTPSLAGLHGLVSHLASLRSFGIGGERTLVVLNRAPKRARAKSELVRALANLTGATDLTDPYVGPVFVSERRDVENLHRDLARFPSSLTRPPTNAVRSLLDQLAPTGLEGTESVPVAVDPGSLGRWADEEAAP